MDKEVDESYIEEVEVEDKVGKEKLEKQQGDIANLEKELAETRT